MRLLRSYRSILSSVKILKIFRSTYVTHAIKSVPTVIYAQVQTELNQ